MMHILTETAAIDAALDRTSRLFLVADFDGTLSPIQTSPFDVRLPDRNTEPLSELQADDRVTIAIVSGRTVEDVRNRVELPLVFSGNHGLEIRGGGLEFEHAQAAEMADLLAEICRTMEIGLEPWAGAWVENKRLTATVHYRNVSPRDQYRVVLCVRAHMARFGCLFGLRAGKAAIEIHPRIGWNKGSAVQYIRRELGLDSATCICIGDDRTDESMFTALDGEFTIHVGGDRSTSAAYFVRDTQEVSNLLEWLAARMRTGSDILPAGESLPTYGGATRRDRSSGRLHAAWQ